MINILVLHGPNLNLLGQREPHLYGTLTLDALNEQLSDLATKFGYSLTTFQTNAEHILIDKIHESSKTTHFIIFNPAAFTHTSIALRDALLAVKTPFIEIHLTNLDQREEFRKQSYFSDIAKGTVSGLGTTGYLLALHYINYYFLSNQEAIHHGYAKNTKIN